MLSRGILQSTGVKWPSIQDQVFLKVKAVKVFSIFLGAFTQCCIM